MIQQELNMRKLSAQCLSRNLTKDQKYMFMMCQGNLQWLWHNRDRFFSWTVIQDEMLVHPLDPETEQQSMQLKHSSLLFPNKLKAQVLAGKFMTTTVGCYDGRLNAERSHYHRLILLQLTPKPDRFRCSKTPWKSVVWSPPLSWQCSTTQSASDSAKYAWMQIWTAASPPCTPHLAPSVFSLFPKIKGTNVFAISKQTMLSLMRWCSVVMHKKFLLHAFF